MDRRYNEKDILLILNYDTHGNKCLTYTQRCFLHKLSNDLYFNRTIQPNLELKRLIDLKLAEIHYKNYERVRAHYVLDDKTQQLFLIQTY